MSKIKIEKIEYLGWKNCVKIDNGIVEVIITTDIGPRIIHYGFISGPNHMKVFKEQAGDTCSDEWKIYGGHRLWHSPEDKERTCDKDNFTCSWKEIKNGLWVKSNTDPWVQVDKEIEVILDENSTRLTINHKLTNRNAWDVEYAVWALTVMAKGGREIIPQTTTGPVLLPNRSVTLWTYAKMNDPRVKWLDKYIILDQSENAKGPFKIGLPVTEGWAAYSNFDQLFVKYFKHFEDKKYPDFGMCSYETYTNNEMLEMETLSPLYISKPGETIEHKEIWELHDNVQRPENEEDIDTGILPLMNKG